MLRAIMTATLGLSLGTAGASELPIPELARWEANMITVGRRHAASLAAAKHTMPPLAEAGTSVYYDGAFVFQNIAAYTGDASWYAAADDALYVYRDRAIRPNDCAVVAYWNFTDGMRLHWQRTGSTVSRDTVLTMAQRSWMTDWSAVSIMWPFEASRETAYVIEGLINARKVGGPERARLAAAVDCALGHIDQWFGAGTATYARTFMVGLTCRALIEYHAMTGDARIEPAVRLAMERCWRDGWVPADEGFEYDIGDGLGGSPTLNLMIAPAMAWLYVRTGDTVWRDRGDAAFAGCAKFAWIDGMKQFNQVYRWGFDYVKWRQAGPAVSTPPNQAPVAHLAASATTGVAPLAIAFSAAGSSDADGTIASSAWTFGDGTTASGVTAAKTFASAGTYTVGLTVSDDDGATATASTVITVTAPPTPPADAGVVGIGTGLRGEYFDDIGLSTPGGTRVDQVVDFDWGGGSPGWAIGADTFSARWTGTVLAPRGERLTFHVVGDDGVRLWIDGQLIVDAWVDQGPTEWSGAIDAVRGRSYAIRLEYYENGGGATARLRWSSPTMAKTVVPTSQLYPTASPTPTTPAVTPAAPVAGSSSSGGGGGGGGGCGKGGGIIAAVAMMLSLRAFSGRRR